MRLHIDASRIVDRHAVNVWERDTAWERGCVSIIKKLAYCRLFAITVWERGQNLGGRHALMHGRVKVYCVVSPRPDAAAAPSWIWMMA